MFRWTDMQPLNRALFGLVAFFCGAICTHLGGALTSTVFAAPETKQEAKVDADFDGLSIERSEESLAFTVNDPDRTFLILGTDPSRETLEWPSEDQRMVQTSLPGSMIKVSAGQASRVYELVAVANCPAFGICLPCEMNSCTGPIPPPGGPEPPWMEGFWLNDHMARR